MKSWGLALELLRERKGWSQGDLVRAVGMERSQYYTLRYKSKKGPGIATVDAFLEALGYTWHDWAKIYEQVKDQREYTRESAAMIAEEKPTYGRPRKRGHKS